MKREKQLREEEIARARQKAKEEKEAQKLKN